jgi:hypothetical protein
MPSIDEDLLVDLHGDGKWIVFAEQNNGYLWQNFLKTLYRHRERMDGADLRKVVTINTLSSEGRPRFIHSATYEELIAAFSLDAEGISRTIRNRLKP